MASTKEMRESLKKVYDGPKWADKVKNMTEAQVFAIYVRLRRQNKI